MVVDLDKNILPRPALPDDDLAFAQRVINYATAQKRPKHWTAHVREFWADLSEPVVIPKPAYVLAALALFGFLIGALSGSDTTIGNGESLLGIFYETGGMI